MTFNIEKYTLLTYARWARDFQYYNLLFLDLKSLQNTDISTERDDTRNEGFPIKIVESLLDEHYEKFHMNFRKIFSHYQAPIQINQEIFEKFPVLKKPHARATIWKRSDTKAILRGYLTELSYQEPFFSHIFDELNKQGFKIFSTKNTIKARKKTLIEYQGQETKIKTQLCMLLKISKLGFFEIELISCDLDQLIKSNDVYNIFDTFLSSIDPDKNNQMKEEK